MFQDVTLSTRNLPLLRLLTFVRPSPSIWLKHTKTNRDRSAFFFFAMAFPAHSEPRPLIQLRNHLTQSVGLLGRVISTSQGRYLNTGQHKRRINEYTNFHALSGIRTHDPGVRGSEDSLCLRPRGYCDRLGWQIVVRNVGRFHLHLICFKCYFSGTDTVMKGTSGHDIITHVFL
jgi:hypothetical protein